MDMVLFGAGCMILGGMIGASVGLLMYALCYVSKRGEIKDENMGSTERGRQREKDPAEVLDEGGCTASRRRSHALVIRLLLLTTS